MKGLLIALLLSSSAQAAPYFVFPWHKDFSRQVITEACFNPNAGIGATASCTSVLAVQHPAKNGFLLIPGVDWAVPVGVSTNFTSSTMFVTGVSANLLPALQGVLLRGLDMTTKEESFRNLKALLTPVEDAKPDVSVNVGAKWGVAPQQEWKGYFLLSVGPALKF